ncbi:hypothetical protein [Amycolatopsis pittospori]|uniref:hypothetical protein n=1 Tax=Amycolatopsis pittospori TaxID=2749434 RepID=UPI0015F02D41|nr:hypothetical protein [Amycolatopsis pittospori]
MNWDTASKLIAAGVPVLGALIELYRRREGNRQRRQLKIDVDLVSSLPEDSAARARLLTHIDNTVELMLQGQNELRREPTGITLAIILIVAAGGLIVLAVRSPSSWWLWIPAGFCIVLGLVGLSQDAVPRKRDVRGRPLKEQ